MIAATVAAITANISFPFAEKHLCYDGVEKLAPYYHGHDVKFAYNDNPGQGHVWLIVDGQPIDTYYGIVYGSEWTHPQHIYNSFAELEQGVIEITGIKDPRCA